MLLPESTQQQQQQQQGRPLKYTPRIGLNLKREKRLQNQHRTLTSHEKQKVDRLSQHLEFMRLLLNVLY